MENEKVFIEALLNPKTQQNAFRELLHLYQKPLYFHIRNIVLNHDDADDVLQNTFLKIYQNLSNFKGESKLYSWMYRIATNEALNFINQKARKNGTTIEEWQNKAINSLESDTYYDGDEIQVKLQKAIADLPEKQQLVFKMKYFQEMKYEEISEIVDTSVGALKASYHIAVKKIEEYLKNN
ncbi:RNA polymerase sigma factor [Flavobacterium sp. NRK F10]|uniref:RNA polymerase sigma factor n=1 Tax=Flavobacterium sp. NRK F10 TaxID=2954931 RepID=UPI002091342A|nr:RNA polymerase sigma factor [Flavobacterium sp. NRK F10]MCO6176096.1 RNA polymerase sigma factor [Flavobacterium sp. NRK F10]